MRRCPACVGATLRVVRVSNRIPRRQHPAAAEQRRHTGCLARAIANGPTPAGRREQARRRRDIGSPARDRHQGNTHFPFSDLNNLEIADLVSRFLAEKKLD
jgi:hypothetical protein